LVHAALVAELALAVEDEHVRRRGRAVLARDLLRVAVVEEREVELPEGRTDLHVVERVADVRVAHLVEAQCLDAVRLDHDEGHALRRVVVDDLTDALLVDLRGRTMHRREDHDEGLRRREAGERVGLAVYPGQAEIRRERADGER